MDMTTAIARAFFFWGGISLISLLLGIWITYLVIKNAVRDGIRESGLIEVLRRRTSTDPGLPHMTID